VAGGGVLVVEPVAAPVVENIRQRVARVASRLDLRCLIPIRENLAAAAIARVDCARRVDREALHAACECARIGGLDEQVQMIALDRQVNHAEIRAPEIAGQDAA
jgi:hypothetical protein